MTAVETAADIDEVRQVVAGTDPCASVYVNMLPAEPTTDTSEDLSLRWRALAARLRRQGADAPTVDVLGHPDSLPPAPTTYAMFATQGAHLMALPMPDAATAGLARFGAPPDVVGPLAWQQRHPPHVGVGSCHSRSRPVCQQIEDQLDDLMRGVGDGSAPRP